MNQVLLLEDDMVFGAEVERLLKAEGWSVVREEKVSGAVAVAQRGQVDVILADYFLRGDTVLDLLQELADFDRHLPVVVMTSQHTAENAIRAVQAGAYDYWPKPAAARGTAEEDEYDELLRLLEAAAENRRLAAGVGLPGETAIYDLRSDRRERMIGASRPMREVFRAIGQAAGSDATVLIRGETGTGKELAARAVYSHSDRAGKPFIVVNAAAIPESLLESELFGHERGAFTGALLRRVGKFEQANGGTLFLDEIGDMSPGLQQKLLRVLQERTVERVGGQETIRLDVRIIAATNRNLEEAMAEGAFRQDLYYRLNVVNVNLPPLRERTEDIAPLFDYFWRRYASEFDCWTESRIDAGAVALLKAQPWPGNVRELRNVVRKTMLLAGRFPVTEPVVAAALRQMAPPEPKPQETFAEFIRELLAAAREGKAENLKETIDEMVDRELYAQAMERAGGDQSQVARWLGVSRPTVLERVRKFGLKGREKR